MLELDYLDVKGCITPKEISALVQQSTILLQAAKQGEVCFADSLGWLSSEEWANDAFLTTLEKVAAKVRAEADAFVLIGVGGSNNAARAVIEALQKENVPEIIYMGNTLSPFALQKQLQKLEGKSFYIDCIAKNFETLEPGASFRALRAILQKQYGERAHTRIIATGTRGSSLEVLCAEHGYTFFEFPTNIGGRYTAISNVGLLPMAVAGIDVRAVVDGAKKMEQRLKAEPAACNLALRYACIRNLLYRKGYRLEMLSCFEPAYHWFFKWWIQLFAESEGKDGKGLFPVASEYSEELHSVGQYVQDGEPLMFETFLNVQQQNGSLMLYADAVKDAFDYLDEKDFWEINKASFVATRRAHSEKLPCLTLNIDCMDAASFGELFYFFQFACYLSARILGVNPFNQPGVEAYKGWMFNELGKS